jgi:alanine racemase
MTVAGQIVPVVGRISMDLTTIDLSELADKGYELTPGEEVIIIDNVRGAPNSIESIAAEIQTATYEFVTQLGPRIVRVAAG